MICGGQVRLKVKDVEASVRFYVETLGMKLVEHAPGSAVLDCGDGFSIDLTEGDAGVTLHPKMPLSEATAILENRGVSFGERHRFVDPDGNVFYLAPRV